MTLYLREDFKQAWQGKDPFAEVLELKGEVFREVKERVTLRFELNDKSYFLKLHRGIGWREIFKNWSQFNRPILGADLEYQAIQKLHSLNVETMSVAAYGEIGSNPAKKLSFIITDDLVGTENLEDFCRLWPQQPPKAGFKRLLIERIANVSRTLRENGLNHRDYYLCHFHLDLRNFPPQEDVCPEDIHLHLIDLHRMQCRENMPTRWAIKDIGGLYFSAMEIGLTQRDLFRFMRLYKGKPLRDTLREDKAFWQSVQTRAEQLYAKGLRKGIVGNSLEKVKDGEP
ncbi:MAG: lipopolysaccharide core heptose(I) kinase RfaP [Pseudomonadales bacterium]